MSYAQSFAPGKSLLNSRARSKVDERLRYSVRNDSAGRRGRSIPAFSDQGSVSRSLVEELKFGTVDDLIFNSAREVHVTAESRGELSQQAMRDYLDLREPDEFESEMLAQRVFLFQTAKSVSDYIRQSPLEETYRTVARGFRTVGRYLSLNVTRQVGGGIQVGQGEHEGSRLMEFKLHASARNGVEPRLRVSDQLVLRYDLFNQGTILEFCYDF